jgi:DNA/RNA-binding domain of Phe-tRNA-synthetase-like protein
MAMQLKSAILLIGDAMLAISATEEWRRVHPGATIGLLELSGVQNTGASARLNERKRAIETGLRERYQGFSRKDFLALPVMTVYDRYYTRFNKTYHVQLQLESIVLKGKSLPLVSPAVDANFMAEVATLILTAGHDADKLSEPVTIDVSRDGDHMTQMNGTSRALRPGDMIMRNAAGVSCSIIYGQDARSPITPTTSHALYVAYAPAGIPGEIVDRQLREIDAYVRLFSADFKVEQHRLLTA